MSLPLLCAGPSGVGGWDPLKPVDGVLPTLWIDGGDPASLYTDAAMTIPVANDADLIYTAADKSGNGNHAVQATQSKRPSYKVGIQNGLSVMRYDGSDDYLAIPAGLSLQSLTIVDVIRAYVVSKRLMDGDANGAVEWDCYGAGGKMRLVSQATKVIGTSNTVLSTATTQIKAILFDGINYIFYHNGIADGSGANATTFTNPLKNIGSSNPAYTIQIDLMERLIYAAAIGADGMAVIHEYANARWLVYA